MDRTRDDSRPDPDAMLVRAQAEERPCSKGLSPFLLPVSWRISAA